MLFDEIASIYLFEKYIYILALEMASPGNQAIRGREGKGRGGCLICYGCDIVVHVLLLTACQCHCQ